MIELQLIVQEMFPAPLTRVIVAAHHLQHDFTRNLAPLPSPLLCFSGPALAKEDRANMTPYRTADLSLVELKSELPIFWPMIEKTFDFAVHIFLRGETVLEL